MNEKKIGNNNIWKIVKNECKLESDGKQNTGDENNRTRAELELVLPVLLILVQGSRCKI